MIEAKEKEARKGTLPPGPRGLPVMGSLLSIQKDPLNKINEITKKYGDVCMMTLGGTPTVFISHPEILRPAFRMRELSDRWNGAIMEAFLGGRQDLVFGHYNERWRDLSRYANQNILSYRRISDVGERFVEPMMDFLLDTIGKKADSGEIIEPRQEMSHINTRTMVDILFGVYGYTHNEDILESMEAMRSTVGWFFTNVSITKPIRYMSWLGNILPNKAIREARSGNESMSISVDLDDVKADPLLDIEHPHSLIEVMLRDHEDGKITYTDIGVLIADLAGAGIDTTAQTMTWLILALTNRPEIQDRMFEEMESVDSVGRRELSIDDMPKIPYTHAVIMENLRYNTLLPFSLPHRASQTCEVEGYTIPEGAQVLGNVYGIHRDERFWEAPEEFMPERFMPQEDGSPSPNMQNEAYMPFGVGRRACPGQGLAQIILGLQTMRLLHNFRFEPPPGTKDGKIPELTHFGLSAMPKPYSVKVTRRK